MGKARATRQVEAPPPKPRRRTPVDVTNIDTRLMLTVKEVAHLLHIGTDKVYRLILDIDPVTRKPKLYSVKDGRLRRIPRIALDRYIKAQCYE